LPYADSNGVKIYYEVEGNADGPPLVLQHGLTGYLESWRERGYTKVLGGDYRLILVDARGHGRSDKPHEPEAYVRELRAADVVAVLDDLGIEKTYYFGYSMAAESAALC
jgi:pimeloyl-ACP methyl ester carboxylesterase